MGTECNEARSREKIPGGRYYRDAAGVVRTGSVVDVHLAPQP
jgi:hypothetical protein